jgi:hypothetical protein
MMYIAGLSSWMLGSRTHAMEYFGRAWALIIAEHAYEEAVGFPTLVPVFYTATHKQTYATWNPVERELRRRVFWLIIGGNKSSAILMSQLPISPEFYTAEVQLPSLVYA